MNHEHLSMFRIILNLDVFEHAYYSDYKMIGSVCRCLLEHSKLE